MRRQRDANDSSGITLTLRKAPGYKASTRMPARRRSPAALNQKRDEIFRTAARVFRERGFDGTSVGDVARALKMTKAGLYHYFPGKEALLFETLSFGLDQVRDEVTEPARSILDPEARLREFIVRHARTALHA